MSIATLIYRQEKGILLQQYYLYVWSEVKVSKVYRFCEMLYVAVDPAVIYYSAVIRYFSITQSKRLRLLII